MGDYKSNLKISVKLNRYSSRLACITVAAESIATWAIHTVGDSVNR